VEFGVWWRKKPLYNYKNKCKTTTDISTTKKGYSAMRGCDRGIGQVRNVLQSPSLFIEPFLSYHPHFRAFSHI